MVGLGRVELPTRSLGNCCSIHLSYSPDGSIISQGRRRDASARLRISSQTAAIEKLDKCAGTIHIFSSCGELRSSFSRPSGTQTLFFLLPRIGFGTKRRTILGLYVCGRLIEESVSCCGGEAVLG